MKVHEKTDMLLKYFGNHKMIVINLNLLSMRYLCIYI